MSMILGSTGCYSPHISMPTFQAMDPRVERIRHERHDPLPLNDLGPGMTRGRDYAQPRSYTRRAQENYSKVVDPNRSQVLPPPSPFMMRQYPDIVTQ